MSETTNENRQYTPVDHEGEWDAVVRRIAERVRKKPATSAAPQSSLELTSELVRVERRALEAEAALQTERDAYAVRVREMEEKLQKVKPWLDQLKGEYQRAAAERDKLRAEMKSAGAPSAADAAKLSVLTSEREAALREAEAARTARDVALAEAESLRRRVESVRSTLQSSWQEKVVAAEKARDQALEDLKTMRKAAGDSRRTEEELKRLQKEVEQLDKTTSAHKAVARAAQEEVLALKARIAEVEKAGEKTAEIAEEENQRVVELVRQLEQSRADLAAAQRRLSDAENVHLGLRAEHDETTRALADKSGSLETARREIDEVRGQLDRLRGESAELRRQAEDARAETTQAKSEAAQAKREAESAEEDANRAKSSGDAARAAAQKAREECAAAQKEATEARELAEEAMRVEDVSRRRAEESAAQLAAAEQSATQTAARMREIEARSAELAEQLAAQTRSREEAERRVKELDARAEQAELRVPELESQLQAAGGRVRSLETEMEGLTRSIEEDRQTAAQKFAGAETAWQSQMRAAESRFEADLQREAERARQAEESLVVLDERFTQAVSEHEAEILRLRDAALQFATAKAQELVAGMQRVIGSHVAPVDLSRLHATVQGESTMSVDTVPIGPLSPPGAAEAPAEWDRVISDVEQLWTEVETMRQETQEIRVDTGRIITESVETAAPPAAAPAQPTPKTATITAESAPAKHGFATPDDLVFDQEAQDGAAPLAQEPAAADAHHGKRGRKRRR